MRAGTPTETTAGLPEPSAEPTRSCINSLRGTDSLPARAWLDVGPSRASAGLTSARCWGGRAPGRGPSGETAGTARWFQQHFLRPQLKQNVKERHRRLTHEPITVSANLQHKTVLPNLVISFEFEEETGEAALLQVLHEEHLGGWLTCRSLGPTPGP